MKFEVEIEGTKLMMHNGQLADPLNEYTKALKKMTLKKKKTDEDHLAVAKAEFQGGLYHDDEIGPFIPGEAVTSALIQASKAFKLGKKFSASVGVAEDKIKLQYKGPRDREGLLGDGITSPFVDRRAVRVQMAKVMRTRPIFHDWSCKFTIETFDQAVNADEVEQALKVAGESVGLLEGRPRIAGKFIVTSFKEI